MQKEPNRLLQKSDRIAKFGDVEIFSTVQNQVSEGLILHPKLPASQLADALIGASPDVASVLADVLVRKFYVRAVLAERRKQSPQAQFRLPGFEHLPAHIQTAKGKRVRLLSANTYGLREYYRVLMAKHRERRKADPRIKEVQRLLEKMRKVAPGNKGVTVREVLFLDEP